MVFAAGLGTRLRPLTDTRPKALVEINGEPLIVLVLQRLRAAGVDAVIINLHHFGGQIEDYLSHRGNFGLRLAFSYEETLLDTGGGLKLAGYFFDDGRPFLVHNVDVVSDIDLTAMYRHHLAQGNLATLAAMPRHTQRHLLFDSNGLLCGWRSLQEERIEWARSPEGEVVALAFGGIHVISPALLAMMEEQGAFSIVRTYLRLAGRGEKIGVFRTDGCYWRDVGKLADLERIARELRSGLAR